MKLKRAQVAVKEKEDKKEVLNLKSDFESLIEKADRINSECEDFVVRKANSNNVRFSTEYGIKLGYSSEDEVTKVSNISRYALGQLGTKIGVPVRYLEKCIRTGRLDLAEKNVNSWLKDYNKDLFIREYNGRIRGVLSSKYSVCDSHDILNVVHDVVDHNKFEVKGSFLNEERLHLRLVGKEMLPIDGEDLFAGLFIDSSDVGRSILNVQFGIYKLVCTNGLVVGRASGTLFRQKHIGISTDEFYEGLEKSLKNVDILTENAVEWVQRTKRRLNHWSVNSDYEDDIQEFVNYIRQQTNLSENSSRKVIDLMKTKYEDNRWGLINGITEVAQDFTLERRLELERIAGGLLVA